MKFKLIEQWFNTYVKSFKADSSSPIRIKIEHSIKVSREICDIAKNSGLTGDELVLAETIGLLHDIGRFEQYSKYKTFLDGKSENHAHLGVKVLKEQAILEKFSKCDRMIILKAIECHNAKKVTEGLSKKEKMFAELIRDADKIDIFRVVIDYYKTMQSKRNEAVELNLPDIPGFSEAVIKDLLNEKSADYNELKTLNDFKILQIGWVYDLNFKRSYQIVSERNYISQIYETLPKNETVDNIYRNAKQRIENKIAKNLTG
jgi:putative nucleotidyltransferase with HDIG domain